MVDISGGVAAIQRGAGQGIDATLSGAQMKSRALAGLGNAATGIIDDQTKRQDETRHVDALAQFGRSIGADEAAMNSRDPEVMAKAIGLGMEQLKARDQRSWQQKMEEGRLLVQGIEGSFDKGFSYNQDKDMGRAAGLAQASDAEAKAAADRERYASAVGALSKPENQDIDIMGSKVNVPVGPTPQAVLSRAGGMGSNLDRNAFKDVLGAMPEPPKAPAPRNLDPNSPEVLSAKTAADIERERRLKQEGLGSYAQKAPNTDPLLKEKRDKLVAETDRLRRVEEPKARQIDPTLRLRLAEYQKRRSDAAGMFDTEGVQAAQEKIDEILGTLPIDTGGGGQEPAPAKDPAQMSDEEIDAYLREKGLK